MHFSITVISLETTHLMANPIMNFDKMNFVDNKAFDNDESFDDLYDQSQSPEMAHALWLRYCFDKVSYEALDDPEKQGRLLKKLFEYSGSYHHDKYGVFMADTRLEESTTAVPVAFGSTVRCYQHACIVKFGDVIESHVGFGSTKVTARVRARYQLLCNLRSMYRGVDSNLQSELTWEEMEDNSLMMAYWTKLFDSFNMQIGLGIKYLTVTHNDYDKLTVISYIKDNMYFQHNGFGNTKKERICNAFRRIFKKDVNSRPYVLSLPVLDRPMNVPVTSSAESLIEIDVVEPQMDEISGEPDAGDDAQKETVITQDSGVENTLTLEDNAETISRACSSSIMSRFGDLTSRWVCIDQMRLISDQEVSYAPWKSYTLPRDILKVENNPVVLPFKQYKFIRPTMEFKVVVNSNRFNQGRLVVSYLHQGDQITVGDLKTETSAALSMRSVKQALQRDHVFIDLNSSNIAQLEIPFVNTQGLISNFERKDELVQSSAVVDIFVLSPLRIPDEGQKFVNLQVFARFSDVGFTGLCPARLPTVVQPQMDILAGIAGSVLGPVLGSVGEAATGAIGGVINNIAGGLISGVGDVIGGIISPVMGMLSPQRKSLEGNFSNPPPLNLDKPANHEQPSELRPNALGDMAIAVRQEPKFSMRLDSTVLTPYTANQSVDRQINFVSDLTQIWSLFDRFVWSATQQTQGEELWSTTIMPGDARFKTTTLGYFANIYAAYSGSIEFRFDFICTEFHIGSLVCAFIPFDSSFNEEQSRAGIWKYFDMQQQRQYVFTVPYIDSSLLRPVSGTRQGNAFDDPGSLKVFLKNSLVPVSTVSQEMEVLVFVRAAPDFHYTMLQDSSIKSVEPQMDDGEKEQQDGTTTIQLLSSSGVRLQIAEDHELIPDILKRWYRVGSMNVDGSASFDVAYPFGKGKRVPAAVVLDCFRYVRGGQCFTLIFRERKQSSGRADANVVIEPLIVDQTPIPDKLPDAPQMVAPKINGIQPNEEPDLKVPALHSKDMPVSDLMWTTREEGGRDWTVWYPLDDSNERYDYVSNPLLQQYRNDAVSIRDVIDTNDGALSAYANVNNKNMDISAKNFDQIKSSMDANTSVNSYLRGVTSSTNRTIDKEREMSFAYNTNAILQNANNANIVKAIDGGGGGEVSIAGGTVITVNYQPVNNQNSHVSPSFEGNPSQVVLTSINQSLKFYVPYYQYFNYLSWKNTSPFLRDKLSETLGTITITSSQPVTAEIYWSAADDFTPVKFIGVPLYAQGQMDEEISTDEEYSVPRPGITPFYRPSSQITPDIQGLQRPRQFSDFVHKTRDVGYKTFTSLKDIVSVPFRAVNTVDKLDRLADKASEVLSDVTSCAQQIVDKITGCFPWITNTAVIFSSVIHMLQAFINPTPSGVLLGILGTVSSLGLITSTTITSLMSFLLSKLRTTKPLTVRGECQHSECTRCGPKCSPNCRLCEELEPLFNTKALSTLGGLIMGSMTAILGLRAQPLGVGIFAGLFKIIPSFWTSVTHSVRFLEDFITLIKRIFFKVCRSDPAMAEAAMVAEDREQVMAFVREAQVVTDMLNHNSILNDPVCKRRFWMCVVTAYSLQEKYLMARTNNMRELLALCNRVIKLANELSIESTNSVVRYEPFVLGLKGGSAIGKSYLMQQVIPQILADKGTPELPGIGLETHESPIFNRTPGVKFWNGYRNQKAIVYDDFLASTAETIASEQIIELYNLKSSAVMNCNMASLEEKNLTANPFLVCLLMNKVVVPNGITEPEAFLRRKDSMWEVSIKPKGIQTLGGASTPTTRHDYTPEEQARFEHLEFRKYVNSADPASMTPVGIDYQTWLRLIKEEVAVYHNKEKENVRRRFESLKVCLPEAVRTMVDSADPFKIFYAAQMQSADNSPIQTGLLPSELLRLQLDSTNNALDSLLPESAEGQIGFSDAKRKVAEAFATVRGLPARIARQWANYLYPGMVDELPVDTCVLCNESKSLSVLCESNVPHGLCSECYIQQQAFSPRSTTTCSYCRSPVRIVELSPRGFLDSMYYVNSYFTSSKFNFYNLKLLALLTAYLTFSTLFIVAVHAGTAKATVDRANHVASLFGRPPCMRLDRWGPFFFSKSIDSVQPEMDEDEEVYHMPAVVDEFPMYVHERNFPPAASPNGVCHHGEMMSYVEHDRFASIMYDWDGLEPYGTWRYGQKIILDNRCDDEQCPFTTSARWRMISTWVDKNKQVNQRYMNEIIAGNDSYYPLPKELFTVEYMRRRQGNDPVEPLIQAIRGKSWMDCLKEKWLMYGKWIKVAMAAVAALASLLAGYKFCSSLFSISHTEPQLSASGDFKTIKAPRGRIPRGIFSKGQMDDNFFDTVEKKISYNTIFMHVHWEEEGKLKKYIFRGLGIYGREVLFTRHEIECMLNGHRKGGSTFNCVVRPFVPKGISSVDDLSFPFDPTSQRMRIFSDADLCCVTMPLRMPLLKDITSLVASKKQHSQRYDSVYFLLTSKQENVMTVCQTALCGLVEQNRIEAVPGVHGSIVSKDVYVTRFQKPGYCGTVGIVLANNPIFCFHYAGYASANVGYGIPLIREDLLAMKAETVPYEAWVPKLAVGQTKMDLDGEVWKIGQAPKVPFSPSKSGIIPSLLNGKIEGVPVLTSPGILSSKDPRYQHDKSPLYWGAMKHTRPPKELQNKSILLAEQHLRKLILFENKPLRVLDGPLDLVTAVAGKPGLPHYDSLVLSTSVGYPYNCSNKTKKEDYVRVTRGADGVPVSVDVHQSILRDMELKMNLRKCGVRPFTVFQDTLKDERRKERKLLMKDGTRVFSQSPIDFTISARQYFLDFSAAFQKNRHHLHHAIGISTNSPEWGLLVDRLRSVKNFQNQVVSGDFSDFGPRMWSSLVLSAGRIVNDWFLQYSTVDESENNRVRSIMMEEIAMCNHVCHDLIYQTFCGIPSGHPLTTVINTMVHLLLMRVAWVEIMASTPFAGLDNFDIHVREICYGDDGIFSVSDDVAELFNCQTLAQWYEKYDFKYTDASKTGNIKYQPLSASTFLKCGFKEHPKRKDQWLAPLEITSIEECPQWVFKSASIEKATYDNAEQSLMLAYGHGPTYFDRWKKKLNEALKQQGMQMLTTTWDIVDEMFYGEVAVTYDLDFIKIDGLSQTDVKREKELFTIDVEDSLIVERTFEVQT